jgi:hypothetical protein
LRLEERREGGVLLEVRLERSKTLLCPILERAVREILCDQVKPIHATMIARSPAGYMGRSA